MKKVYNIKALSVEEMNEVSVAHDGFWSSVVYKTEPKVKDFYANQGYKIIKISRRDCNPRPEAVAIPNVANQTFAGVPLNTNPKLKSTYKWITGNIFVNEKDSKKRYIRMIIDPDEISGYESDIFIVYKNNILDESKSWKDIVDPIWLKKWNSAKSEEFYLRDIKCSNILALERPADLSRKLEDFV